MQLQLILTVDEAEARLNQHREWFQDNQGNDFAVDVKIERPAQPKATEVFRPDIDLAAIINKVRAMDFQRTQKIAAIKLVREMFATYGASTGLCSAKIFVESLSSITF